MFDKNKYSDRNKPLEVINRNWDKYDPDIEVMKLDNKEKLKKLELQRKRTNNGSGLLFGTNNTSDYEDRNKCMKSYVDRMFQSKCSILYCNIKVEFSNKKLIIRLLSN